MARAVFMGSDSFSVPIFDALLRHGPDLRVPVAVAGAVTRPDARAGRGRKLSVSPVKVLADGAGVPVLQPERVRNEDAVADILTLSPDVIVVASYGQILPRRLLDTPPGKCLNLHPSLLPRYRGSSPVAAAILNADRMTGTTLMVVRPRMDAGPILDQEEAGIAANETKGELEQRLAELSADLLLRDLSAWLEGRLEPRPQDDAEATYTSRITKEDGLIDWSLPAEEIGRRVRAFNPWPTAYTYWSGRQLRVLRAGVQATTGAAGRVMGLTDAGLSVGTGEGSLILEVVQLAGGRPLPAAEFVRGHAGVLGAQLGT